MRKIGKHLMRVIVQRAPSEKCFGGCGADVSGDDVVCDKCAGWDD